jgi:hypothetical protein
MQRQIHRWRTDIFTKIKNHICGHNKRYTLICCLERKRLAIMWRIVLMAILCMQLVACSAAADLLGKVGGGSATPITKAVEKCKLTDSYLTTVWDDGRSLILLAQNSETFDSGTRCVMQELGIPQYINLLIFQTREIDGMQREEFDAYKIYWSYSFDRGISIIIHMK